MRPHLGGLSCGRVWLRLPRRGAGLRHFLRPTGLPALLERYLPVDDARCRLAPGTAVWLVVTNLLLGRAPLYALGEWAAPFAPHLLRLATGEAAALNDDRVGRALEHLFDADRASLLTELILGVVARFGVETAELHNDSTSVSVHGAYSGATGTPRGGKPTPVITFRPSKIIARTSSNWYSSSPWPPTGRTGCLPAGRRQHQRRPDPRAHLGRPGRAARTHRLPLRRRLEAGQHHRDGSHRLTRWPVRHGAASQPGRGQVVP